MSFAGAVSGFSRFNLFNEEDPETEYLARVTEPQVNIRARPDVNIPEVCKFETYSVS